MDNKIFKYSLLFLIFIFLFGCNMPPTEMEEASISQAVQQTVTAIAESGYYSTPTDINKELGNESSTDGTMVETSNLGDSNIEETLPTMTVTETSIPSETVIPTTVVVGGDNTITASATQYSYDARSFPTITNTPIPTTTSTPTPTATNVIVVVADEAATPTNFPTFTPTITATYACDRAIGRFDATYLSSPPTMDGELDEWSYDEYSIPYVVYGLEKWGGQYDLYGSFQIGWTSQNIYLAVKVEDERYVQHMNSWQLYEGDSLDVFFDRDYCGDYAEKKMDSDDYQIGISPGYIDSNGIKESYQWFPRPSMKLPMIITYTTRTNAHTYYEVMIPWSVFGVYNPVAGNVFGFVLSVSDNDDRQESMQESMISTAAHRAFSPLTWQMLVLK